MKKIELRPNGSRRVQTINTEPTRTQRQFQDQVNVNNIIKKYKKTGSITHIRNAQQGIYADLTQIPDYAEALMQIQHAQQAFEAIPAHIRLKFNNDPSRLIDYLKDPSNKEEAIKHGLLVRRDDDKNQIPNPNQNDAASPQPPPQAK